MLIFIFSLVVYYLLHSLLADNNVKQWLIEKFIPQHYYRLIYNLLAVGFLIPIILQYIQLDKVLLFLFSYWVTGLGYLVFFAGISLLYFSLRGYHLAEFSGTYQLKYKQEMPNQTLTTAGLNKYVRHPLYFSTLFIVWGAFIVIPHYPMLAITCITTLYIIIGAKLEERKLVRVFGKTYQQYQQKVPMLLPNFFAKHE